MRPSISVVITAHNAMNTIGKQLAALDDQVADAGGEIVVANNRSTDDTVAVVQVRGERGRASVRVVTASGRMGISHGRNQGALASFGAALAFVDADDEVQSGWIEAALNGLETHDLVKGMTWSQVPTVRCSGGWLMPTANSLGAISPSGGRRSSRLVVSMSPYRATAEKILS
ncbi:glycosyltransferase family 2 protein [Ornithinimicrobium sp. Arc0846-15]|nr:glycosyltransferase family 2 protein [Ornithinimicrobium laminariae]